MPRRNVRLDSGGIAEVLQRSQVRSEVVRLATAVANGARAAETVNRHGAEVRVFEYTASGGRMRSARPAAGVVVAHPGALGMEAKHGVLAGAAGSAGLTLQRSEGAR